MTDLAKCHACAVHIHRGDEFTHNGHPYHVPCLVRSLQGQVDAITECYEQLRPHVRDRSVLRGLCRFADVAETEGQHDQDEDCCAALDWLRQAAGWEPESRTPPNSTNSVEAVNVAVNDGR